MLIKNGRIITPEGITERGWVLTEGGKIAAVGSGEAPQNENTVDALGMYVSPGFIDIHTHGGGGFDFTDCTRESVMGAAKAHMAFGTTSIVPTLTSCPDSEIMDFIDCYRDAKATMTDGPNLVGIHLEGPYFSPIQSGAQDPEFLKIPTPEHYMPILEKAGKDLVRISAAPELPGALELGRVLREKGIMAAIGHSNADYDETVQAFENGYTHINHLYSCLSTIHRENAFRKLGVVEGAYLLPFSVEIIADGCHLPPELLRYVIKFKPMEQICLVTDSMRGACFGEDYTGTAIMGSLRSGYEVLLEKGVAFLKDHSAFAGSICTSDRCVRTMVKKAGVAVKDAVAMMSRNPAAIIGLENKGDIAPGMDADICIFDDDIRVKTVIVGGKITVG